MLAICFCAHIISCFLKTQNNIVAFLMSTISPPHVLFWQLRSNFRMLHCWGWLCFVSESSNSVQSVKVNSLPPPLATLLCHSKYCQGIFQTHTYLCVCMTTHIYMHVYTNTCIQAQRHNSNAVPSCFSFKIILASGIAKSAWPTTRSLHLHSSQLQNPSCNC